MTGSGDRAGGAMETDGRLIRHGFSDPLAGCQVVG
jgi:hypothetical protein